MARAGAVWIDVLPSLAGWNTAVRTQAAVSLEGVGAASGKGFTAGLMRAVKGGNMASVVEGQARVAADKAAMAVEQASAKVTLARKREADASGAVRVAETKLADLRAKENASAGSLAAAEERLARAQRTQAAAADATAVANKGLAAAQARAAEATTAISTESTVASGRFSAMGAAVTGGASRMTSKLGGLAKGAAAMGGLFAGFEVAKFAGESVHAAMDFQKGSQVLQTAAGELPKNLGMVRSGLMAISSETGTTLDQMTEGMYTVEKAGIRGSKGLDVMRAAAKGAKDEGADLGIVTNALTTIMTTSNGKITDASKAMNAVMVAAGHSKTTLQEFAGSLSSVLPLASKVGIGFDQVSGAISAMTAQGMSAQQTTQDLNHVIASLSTPTRVMAAEMDLFGIKANDVRDKLGKRGLQGTIEYLSHAIKAQLGPSARHAIDELKKLPPVAQDLAAKFQQGLITPIQFGKQVAGLKIDKKAAPDSVKKALLAAAPAMTGYTQALSKMTGGQMGLTTSLMLTGHNAKQFAEATKDVGKAMNSTADFDKKWGITSKTTANELAIAKQSISNVGTALATQLLPSIGKAAEKFATATMVVSKFTRQNWSWLGPVAKGIGALVVALIAWNVVAKLSTALQLGWAAASGEATLATESQTLATRAGFAAQKMFAAGQWLVNGAVTSVKWAAQTAQLVAYKGAQVAAAGASKAWAAAQWLLNAAVTVVKWAALGAQYLAVKGAQVAAGAATKAWAAAQWLLNGAVVAVKWVAMAAQVVAFKAVQMAIAGATKAWAAAQWLLNVALNANPIALAVIAIAALTAGIVIAYKHSQTFRNIVHAAMHGVGVAINFVKDHWKIFLTAFLAGFGPIGIVIALIITHFQTFKNVARAVFGAVASAFQSAVGAANSFGNGVNAVIGNVIGWFGALPGKIKGALSGAAGWLYSTGSDIVHGLINGIGAMGSAVTNALLNLIPGPLKKFAGKLGISSPSKVFHGFGVNIGQGLSNGIDSTGRMVTNAVSKLADKVKKALQAKIKDLQSTISNLKGTISNLKGTIQGTASSVSSAFMPNLFSGSLTDMMTKGADAVTKLSQVMPAMSKLGGEGIRGDFLQQLFASGNSDLILGLASGPASQALTAQSQFSQIQSLSNQIGQAVAAKSPEVAELKHVQQQLAAIEKKLGQTGNTYNIHEAQNPHATAKAVSRHQKFAGRR